MKRSPQHRAEPAGIDPKRPLERRLNHRTAVPELVGAHIQNTYGISPSGRLRHSLAPRQATGWLDSPTGWTSNPLNWPSPRSLLRLQKPARRPGLQRLRLKAVGIAAPLPSPLVRAGLQRLGALKAPESLRSHLSRNDLHANHFYWAPRLNSITFTV